MLRSTTLASFVIAAVASSQVAGFCGPGGPDPSRETTYDCDPVEPAPAEGTVELGKTVDGVFVALEPDETRPMEQGFQGGQHFYASLRVFESEPAYFIYELSLIEPSSGASVGGGYGSVEVCPGGFSTVHNQIVFVDDPNTTAARLRLSGHFESPSSGTTIGEVTPMMIDVRLTPP